MILVSISLIIVFLGFIQFIGWVAQSCVYTDIVLDGSISKLQCSMSMKKGQ